MDYVESIHLKGLRSLMSSIIANSEDGDSIGELEVELPKVLDQAEQMRKFK